MSTIQNIKNFIRHGKQSRLNPAHGEPTTDVSAIHAEPHRSSISGGTSKKHGLMGVLDGIHDIGHKSKAHHHHHHQHQNQNQDNHHHPQPSAQHKPRELGAADDSTSAHHQEQSRQQQAPAEAPPRNSGGDSDNLDRHHQPENTAEQHPAAEKSKKSRHAMPTYPGLERWALIDKMGDGAFSNVYRAKDTTGKLDEVAIKVVRKFEMNSKQRNNILKEVQIMRLINHPNVVKLLDFSESSQFYYIVLELCPGGELFHQIVRLTYFSESLSRHIILQVAKAIEYLHETLGVVHRDIKPENLLFYPIPIVPSQNPIPRQPGDEEKADEGEFISNVGGGGIGQVKVADFGLSKVIWDSSTMTPCGTVGYTAPEIVKDERYSKSVDMWALGCVLYTLLCGFPPFYDESIQVLTEKVARGQYSFLSPWWDEISKPAKDLVSHLLTVDPEKRFSITEFLEHPWIRQTDEETYAAADAPEPSAPTPQPLLETPLNERKMMDIRSPGAINLREVFDVGYELHRKEEEQKRRLRAPPGGPGGFKAGLNALNEESDDDEAVVIQYDPPYVSSDLGPGGVPKDVQLQQDYQTELARLQAQMGSTSISDLDQSKARQQLQKPPSSASRARNIAAGQNRSSSRSLAAAATQGQRRQQQQKNSQRQGAGGYGQHSPAVTTAARTSMSKKPGQFELNLDKATLLGRRGKKEQTEQEAQPVSRGDADVEQEAR